MEPLRKSPDHPPFVFAGTASNWGCALTSLLRECSMERESQM